MPASSKWGVDELALGTRAEATFEPNGSNPKYPVKTNHLNGRRSPKLVLSADARIEAGVPCEVEVVELRSPRAPANGAVIVEFVRPAGFHIPGVYLDPAVTRLLMVQIRRKANILFFGPQGSGKTTAARAIAMRMGYHWVPFNAAVVDTPGGWMANMVCRATPAGTSWDFVPTEIAIALEAAVAHPDRKFLVFIDEFSRVDPRIANGLLSALDEVRQVWCPVTNRQFPIPENVQFILAANLGRSFTGTYRVDPAHLDRLAPIRFNYPSAADETALLRERFPGVELKFVEAVVQAANRVRQADLGGLSVRATQEACSYLADEIMVGRVRQAIEAPFCCRFDGDPADRTSDAATVRTIIDDVLRDLGIGAGP